MNLLIIDRDVRKYQPQLILSEIDDDISVLKFPKVYIYIDSQVALKFLCREYENVIFVCDHDIPVPIERFFIKKINCDIDKSYDFKSKIIRHSFIYQYLFK